MGENTKIQWAHHTFNPWRGCAKVAAGCANCYAEAQSKRNTGTLGVWGPDGSRVVASETMWRQPVAWNKAASCDCDKDGHCHMCLQGPPRVFCASLADVFENWSGRVSTHDGGELIVNPDGAWMTQENARLRTPSGSRFATLDDVRARLFRLIDATADLNWLLLTKRPENIRRMIPIKHGRRDAIKDGRANVEAWRRENVWLGTSIACQEDADRNVPELLKCRDLAAKLFLSIEPLVGPVMLNPWIDGAGQFHASQGIDVDWVIVGGESGPNARPCDIAWIRSVIKQCRDVGVPVFVKQVGAVPFWWVDIDDQPRAVAKDRLFSTLQDSKGGDPAEWPEDLRVREMPS